MPFPLNGNKIITTSGGGMLVSAEKALVQRARFLAQQASDPAPHYEHSVLGNNYRLSNLLAAVGRGGCCRSGWSAGDRSSRSTNSRPWAAPPASPSCPRRALGRATRWLTVMQVDPAEFGATREDIRLHLESFNIEARPVWKPMHLQRVFEGCRVVGGSVAADLFDRACRAGRR